MKVLEVLQDVLDLYSQTGPEMHRWDEEVRYCLVPEDWQGAVVVGDLHGDFQSLERIVSNKWSKDEGLIFLGDYVDRGRRQLDVVVYVARLKLEYPEKVILLRGNHEDGQVNTYYGFRDSVPSEIYRLCQRWFDLLDVFALWEGRFFFVHGGIPRLERYSLSALLSPDVVEDMLWSDPSAYADWRSNPRGAGWLYPKGAVERFCADLGVKALIRGHQPRSAEQARDESKFFSGRLYTVFSTGLPSRDTGYFLEDPFVLLIDRKGGIRIEPIWD